MADIEHLFIHPLMGADDAWSGFMVETPPAVQMSESMLQMIMQHADFATFDIRHPWFFQLDQPLNWPENSLAHCIPTLSAQPPTSVDLDALRAMEAGLRQHKKKLALKASPSQKLPATGTWDYLLITTSHARSLPPMSLLGLSSRTAIVATDIHSHADREWACNNNCLMSSSEFLLNRHPPGKKADLSRLKLLELLALIVNDADTAQIEDIFKQQPKLAYSLMRLVNSAANAPRAPITCFSQAINLLGRRQLQRWLQLLVFADQNTGQHANPLLQKAATRGRLIELLADNPEDDASKQLLDTAFMVGTFSLLDVLLNMPLKEILQHLPLPAAAHAALADHSGLLGQILKAVSASESRDLSGARQQLQHLAITPEKHLTAQLSAFSWATKIHPPA